MGQKRCRVVIGWTIVVLGAATVVPGVIFHVVWLLFTGAVLFTIGIWMACGDVLLVSAHLPESATGADVGSAEYLREDAAHFPAVSVGTVSPVEEDAPFLSAGMIFEDTAVTVAEDVLNASLVETCSLAHDTQDSQSPPDTSPAAVDACAWRIPPSLDTDVVLLTLMESVQDAQPVAAHMWLADEPSGTLRLVSSVGTMRPSSRPIPLDDEGVLAGACAGGTAEFGHTADVKSGGRTVSLWRYAIPLAAGEARGVAAVDLESLTDRPDVSKFPVLVAPVRSSLAGALGLTVARIELQTAQTLINSARDLSRILDPSEVLNHTLERALEVSGGQTGSVMLLDPASGRLSIACAQGLPENVVSETSVVEGEGIAGWVLASRTSVLVEDVAPNSATGRRHGIRSAISVLIADDDGVLGVLNVGSRSYPARLTASSCAALEALGRQAATALRNARAVTESRELYFDTLKALASALETKDPFSSGGAERVLECAEAIGAAMELSEDERHTLCIAALVHDIGMTAAGEGIISSKRPLTTVERALLRLHPKIAADMLKDTPALREVIPIVYHHHEWYDGAGYVTGLAGDRIPLGARILAVADAYVAMTSVRPYRAARKREAALEEIRRNAGTQFDPRVVDALVKISGVDPNWVSENTGLNR